MGGMECNTHPIHGPNIAKDFLIVVKHDLSFPSALLWDMLRVEYYRPLG